MRWLPELLGATQALGRWQVNGRSRILERGLYGHPALSRPCVCNLVGAIMTRVLFDRNSGASPSLAAPSLRLTEVVVYHTHGVLPLDGRGKPWARRESCERFLLVLPGGVVGTELL